MPWIHMRHRVRDYSKWKDVYDATADLKRQYNWRRYRVFAVGGDRNDILVMEEFVTLDDARRWLQSEDLRKAMSLGGVEGEPDTWFLQGLEEGLA